jgi:predicted permease
MPQLGYRLRSWLRGLLGRGRFETGMAEELRFHLEQYAADLVRDGLSPQEAMRRARLAFGHVEAVKDDCRRARGLHAIDETVRALRDSVRLMRRAPGFSITALATLGLCIGANLAIFAVVDSILLRPLPFRDPDRLVTAFNTYPKAGVADDGASLTNYYERRGNIRAFTAMAMYRTGAVNVGERGATEREFVMRVTPDFFETLGVSLAGGREFSEEETTFGNDQVVIATDGFWREQLGADPAVLGRTIRIDGAAMTIVGVLPPDFRFLSSRARLYFPLASPPDERGPDRRHSGSSSRMIARLAPSATVESAQAEIDAHNAAVERTNPQAQFIADAGFRSLVVPLHASHVASVRPMLWLVQAGVVCLLLIGVVNVANLLLIRATARAKELALRQALGESRLHVVFTLLIESSTLTVSGGLIGLLVGVAGVRLLASIGAARLPLGAQIAFDARVALAAAIGSIVLGAVLAIPVVWYHLQRHQAAALNAETRTATATRGAQWLRQAFLAAQIALAFVLLAGAGLLGTSLEQVMSVPPGFRPDHLFTAQVSLPWRAYRSGADRVSFIERLVDALRREPGAPVAGIATNIPLSGNTNKSSATVKGFSRRPGESPRGIYGYGIAGDYFAAMGMSLVEGRFLDRSDLRHATRVCVVDDAFARQYWPRGGALGQRLFLGEEHQPDSEAFTIVGVVGAVKQAGLAENENVGAVYFQYDDRFDSALYLVARTPAAPDMFAATVRRVVRTLDPELPLNNVRSMETRLADSLVIRRSPTVLARLFSTIALLLTAIGTYGVFAYAVAQRRREIAVRIALGARPGQIGRQFLALALRVLALGGVTGLAGAWAAGRALQAILFNVPAAPVNVIASTASVLIAITLLACLLPSGRAARISPVEALSE